MFQFSSAVDEEMKQLVFRAEHESLHIAHFERHRSLPKGMIENNIPGLSQGKPVEVEFALPLG